jgi:hypothetical protein
MLALTNSKLEEYKSVLASSLDAKGGEGAAYVREEKEDEGIYPELKAKMD